MSHETICPGCGLRAKAASTVEYDGEYNASPECWEVYTRVLGTEFGNAVLFGRVHQLTVDSYAVQHAGGRQRDKSVAVHLVGLHLVLERAVPPPRVPPLLQRLAQGARQWPHFEPPAVPSWPITVIDVAGAGGAEEHAARARRWAEAVWSAWAPHHAGVWALAAGLPVP